MEITTIKATVIKTNNYLVSEGKTCVLVDCSMPKADLEKALNGNKLSAILLTHGHWDHFLTVEKIGNTYNVPIYCTKECYAKIIASKDSTLKVARKVNINTDNLNFRFIKNNDVLNFGKLSFKVFSSRGHTDCGVCYLIEDRLFTGDTLFRGTYGRTDLPTGDLAATITTLRRLSKLHHNLIVLPGHGATTSIGAEQSMINSVLAGTKDFVDSEEDCWC